MSQVLDRRPTGLVVASLLLIAAPSVMLASFQYVLVEMQIEFAFSSDGANALAFMPSAASLLIVFIAGSLADRWGPRRLLIIANTLFLLGAVLVALAPGVPIVVLGRVLDGVGGVTMAIVALSVINTSVTEPRMRARVFGIYAAVTPATFMLAPPLAALLVDAAGWRAGLLPGIFLGVTALITTLITTPEGTEKRAGELLTPLLAGLVLAGIALGVTSFTLSRSLSATAIILGLSALLVLVITLRRTDHPTLNVRWCKGKGMFILIIALAVAAMPNLFFYTNLLLQYRYGVSLFVIALLLVVPQACAVVGGLVSGPVSSKLGPARTATVGLFVSALMSLSTLFVTTSVPIWIPVLALAISAAPAAFVVGPMTDTLLSRAPLDASGAGSSMRKATWTLGNVLGGALIGTIAFNSFQSRLSDILSVDGLPFEEAQIIAEEIRNGAIVDELAVRLSEPIARDDLLARGPGLLEAQSYAFAVMGVLSTTITLVAGVLMLLYVRRTADPTRW